MSICRIIHLFPDGQFLRAYEWSAWLWMRFVREFQVKHRLFNGIGQSVAMLGFQASRLESYLPEGVTVQPRPDRGVDLQLPDSILPEEYLPELMENDYEEWHRSLPPPVAKNTHVKDDVQPVNENLRQPCGQVHVLSVMQQILTFDLDEASPNECRNFLLNVRKQLQSLL